jgi:hypothetical protein
MTLILKSTRTHALQRGISGCRKAQHIIWPSCSIILMKWRGRWRYAADFKVLSPEPENTNALTISLKGVCR